MAKIHVLPVTVQNKIAAGEVIERPASVVKELAENAIDAGAAHVAVELEEGGHRLIRVSDDGGGMDEDDLIASMQRHATSKIKDVEDIFHIASFGFRGEALPSIGSVSRLAIATCLPGAGEGHELLVEAGRILRVTPAPPRRGTRVEVRDIFHNTPARRKFLRTAAAESTRASEFLTRLALGNPGVGFRLQSGDRLTLSLQSAPNQLDRIKDIFGDRTAAGLVPFSGDIAPGLAVSGFFAKPPASRRNSKDIYILVNRRWIRFYGLARAAADAFQGILPPREYPFAVINLDVDPTRVDVNAHPTKEEVRFDQEGLIIAGVKRAIREALAGVAAVPTAINLTQSGHLPRSESPFALHAAPAREADDQKALDMPGTLSRARSGDFSGFDLSAARERLRGTGSRDILHFSKAGAPDATSPSDDAGRTEPPRDADEAKAEPTPGLILGPAGTHRILGQANGKYILVDGPDGLLLVDPHALHERWNFDRLVEERKKGGSPHRLLLPLDMRLSPVEAAAAVEAVPSLAEYGFELNLPEANRMTVTAAPSFLPPSKVENLLRQVLADVGEAGEALEAARERILASLACRSSVLLGRTLPEEEMLSLLDRFFHQGQMPTCPHGRPTAIRIAWDELARRFGR